MISIAAASLLPDIQKQLHAFQTEIDRIANYAARVEAAGELYERKRKTVPFRSVKAALKTQCAGAARCMYCEDSYSVDIEHFKPKSFYPELTFVWTNYLYACTRCNRPKSSQFAVYSQSTGQRTDLMRGRNLPVVPPEPGDPLLIDPRIDNPLDFLFLDLRDTFEFRPSAAKGTRKYERAEYTIEILNLNDTLPGTREEAYGNYHSRLEKYISWRNRGKLKNELLKIEREFRTAAHPTVWVEMKRQYERFADLQELFAKIPEALKW